MPKFLKILQRTFIPSSAEGNFCVFSRFLRTMSMVVCNCHHHFVTSMSRSHEMLVHELLELGCAKVLWFDFNHWKNAIAGRTWSIPYGSTLNTCIMNLVKFTKGLNQRERNKSMDISLHLSPHRAVRVTGFAVIPETRTYWNIENVGCSVDCRLVLEFRTLGY